MPRSNREWAVRKIKQALGSLERAANHLHEIAVLYEQEAVQHVSQHCYALVTVISEFDDVLNKLETQVPDGLSIKVTEKMKLANELLDGLKITVDDMVDEMPEAVEKEPLTPIHDTIEAIKAVGTSIQDLRRSF